MLGKVVSFWHHDLAGSDLLWHVWRLTPGKNWCHITWNWNVAICSNGDSCVKTGLVWKTKFLNKDRKSLKKSFMDLILLYILFHHHDAQNIVGISSRIQLPCTPLHPCLKASFGFPAKGRILYDQLKSLPILSAIPAIPAAMMGLVRTTCLRFLSLRVVDSLSHLGTQERSEWERRCEWMM